MWILQIQQQLFPIANNFHGIAEYTTGYFVLFAGLQT